jgi:hypothetical protein
MLKNKAKFMDICLLGEKFKSSNICFAIPIQNDFPFFALSVTMILMVSLIGFTEIDQQINVKSSSDNSKSIKSFITNGNIAYVVYTINGNWNVQWIRAVVVSNGKVTAFNANMAFNNGTAGHTHEFQNIIGKNNKVGLGKDQSASFSGKMDVGTNGDVSWPHVTTQINIDKGKIITISTDSKQTNDHFGGQSLHRTVNAIKVCNMKPRPIDASTYYKLYLNYAFIFF